MIQILQDSLCNSWMLMFSYLSHKNMFLFFELSLANYAFKFLVLQFYCGEKEYNDLATIFFNTQVNWNSSKISFFLSSFLCWLKCDAFAIWLQDDAIRNLFSAKTIHEFSAQSLLTFLVFHYFQIIDLLYVLMYDVPLHTFVVFLLRSCFTH